MQGEETEKGRLQRVRDKIFEEGIPNPDTMEGELQGFISLMEFMDKIIVDVMIRRIIVVCSGKEFLFTNQDDELFKILAVISDYMEAMTSEQKGQVMGLLKTKSPNDLTELYSNLASVKCLNDDEKNLEKIDETLIAILLKRLIFLPGGVREVEQIEQMEDLEIKVVFDEE